MELMLGATTGFFFGFLLQKAQVLRFERQVGFLLFKDMTIIKFMLSAIVVGMVGINFLVGLGVISLKIKTTLVVAQLIGGALFGAGWAICGFCPGTAVGAFAEGRTHALWAIIGMLFGAAAYAEIYPRLKNNILSWATIGKVTAYEVLHVNQWVCIIVFVVAVVLFFRWLESKKL